MERTEEREEAAVGGGHGKHPVTAHHPGRARVHQREDEQDAGDAVHEARGSAVDRVAGLDRVEEPAQAGDLARRQDEQHEEDRHEVAERGERAGAENRLRHIALRIHHLLRRTVLSLEADEREQDQRRDGQKARAGRLQVAGGDSLKAVIESVDQDGHGEERHQRHLEDGAQRRDPLAHAEGDDRAGDARPDEQELEHVVPEAPAADVGDPRGPGRRADERERAAHPKRVGHPVEDRVEPRPEPPHGQLDPLVWPALGGKCRPHLGHHQSVRDQEEDDEDDRPRQRLKAVGGCLSDQIQSDDDRDGEEHHVEAPQRLDQMLLLLDCEGSLLGSAQRCDGGHETILMVARPDAKAHRRRSGGASLLAGRWCCHAPNVQRRYERAFNVGESCADRAVRCWPARVGLG